MRTHAFKTAIMTSARRSLVHRQQRPTAARQPAERVWCHWLTVCVTVADPIHSYLFD